MDIGQIIRDRAAANGVDPAVLARFAQIESGNNPNATNKGSSAKGLFGFTDGTYARYGAPGTSVLDPEASSDAAARLTKDNASGLASAGLETSPGALYLAHFAGLGGAKSLLSADPTAPVGDVLGGAAVKANPFLANMTVADLKNWAAGKMMGGASTPAATGQATSAAQPAAAPSGMLDSAPAESAPEQDDGTAQAIAALQKVAASNQQQAPPPLQPMAIPPPRRIDQATLQKMLSSPLRAGFSLG